MSRTHDRDFRCARSALERADRLEGTASTVRSFLLVEHDGPWGTDALREARMSERARAALTARGVRTLLVRRHRRDHRQPGVRVFAAWAHAERPWLETGVLDRLDDLAGLDLGALAAGRSVGLEPASRPVLAVCTHGRHDACCAERGRPVAAALTASHPDLAWEVSHIGGDRYAGNVLVLPEGLYYGRVEPAAAARLAHTHLSGRLDLDRLRGRSGLPMPAQAAEVALRRRLGETRLDALRVVRVLTVDGVTQVWFEVDGRLHGLDVHPEPAAEARLTCRSERPRQAFGWQVSHRADPTAGAPG